jgi:integrase/recombinase XerD
MSDPSRVRITGPLAAFADGFAAELSEQGYRRNAAANPLKLLAHLSRSLAFRRQDATSLTASARAGLHVVAIIQGAGATGHLPQ